MGDVLPFIARVRASGDWTPGERARLEDLAQQFADHSLGVEAVFGVTEEGDPWCVVKDANEDVLVHVARIGGRFVIHYAASDTIDEGADLHEALAERLGEAARAVDNVVDGAFGLDRHAQILAALLIVAAFFYDTQDARAAEPQHAPPPPAPEPETPLLTPPPKQDASSRQDRDAAAHGAALIDPAEQAAPVVSAPHENSHAAPPAEPAEHAAVLLPPTPVEHVILPAPAVAAIVLAQAAATPAPRLIVGTSGDDHLVGTTGADHIQGGEGNDILEGGGAPAGQFDILDGGAGTDTITVNAQTVAIGGKGADTFVLAMPAKPPADAAQAEPARGETAPAPAAAEGHADAHTAEQVFLGVIADFDARQGDRMVNTRGQTVQLHEQADAAMAATSGATPSAAFTANVVTVYGFTGHRVDVDLDGDGRMDGYVVMGGHAPSGLVDSQLSLHDALVSLIGQRPEVANDLG